MSKLTSNNSVPPVNKMWSSWLAASSTHFLFFFLYTSSYTIRRKTNGATFSLKQQVFLDWSFDLQFTINLFLSVYAQFTFHKIMLAIKNTCVVKHLYYKKKTILVCLASVSVHSFRNILFFLQVCTVVYLLHFSCKYDERRYSF